MFKSIFKKIANDFDFVQDYGYIFYDNANHSITPAVMFKNKENILAVGYKFDNRRIYVVAYELHAFQGNDLLENVTLQGSYDDQVEEAKKVVREYLENKTL